MSSILLRAHALAMRGSIKHMEFFARWSGTVPLADQPAVPGAIGGGGVTVVIAVPRPGDGAPPALPGVVVQHG
ncbi:MAG: hypothetical protein IT181_13130 [Acidobacteria bacterium]|nr:hypothetical protein [Acidobacteriota bacterium]